MKQKILFLALAALGLGAFLLLAEERGTFSRAVQDLPVAVGVVREASPAAEAADKRILGTEQTQLADLQSVPFNPREWVTPTIGATEGNEQEAELLAAVALQAEVMRTAEAQRLESHRRVTPTAAANPMLDTLRELGAEAQRLDGNMLPGVVRRSAAVVESGGADTSDAGGSPKPSPTPGLVRVGGQARGYLMLYLMHPRARATVERQVEALLRAEVNEPLLGVLTDGTFGKEFDYLNDVVSRLSAGGRNLTLIIYLTNGASMRTYSQLPIDAGFNHIAPEQFRSAIRWDRTVREQFRTMVREARSVFEHSRKVNNLNRNIAVVMLEDNLDRESYLAMRELAAGELGDLVQFVRNPCVGCYDGNDGDASGDGIEEHVPEALGRLGARDGFSLDGIGYRFPWEEESTRPGLETVKQLLTLSMQRQVPYFSIWRAERQGRAGELKHPDEREYEVPTDPQLDLEIDLLRHSLPPA